ncbi:adenine-specific DNA-methyltransferase [Burkholderia latens]|uniref:site-specific DNA-methyltransferase n=1 Tax=Burkholderia latens TaxID=488446 RepID=UPI0039A4D9DD
MPFLDWVNKNQAKDAAREVPYHLLKREAAYGDGTASAVNLLIQGDNLLALKALLPFYAGRVKCIFIDPPYNTQSAFEHYDDRLEHSQWLSMMYPRLVLLRELLAEDGSIWVTVDDNEAHYLRVLLDEVFGRENFVANVVWEKVYTPKSNGRGLSSDHDHVLVSAKSPRWLESGWNLIPRNEEQQSRFTNRDGDPNGPWRTYPLDVRTEDGARREKYRYEVVLPSGRLVKPAAGRHWALPQEEFDRQRSAGDIYFGKDGDAMPTKKVYLKDAKQGVIARTWWPYKEVGGNQDAKREILALFGDSGFITPKPEGLIARILTIATNPGDLVLDSYLGSGTTAAVAHKMGRRYIGIEMGEQARTHCLPRLEKVIAGEQGGISKAVEWKGGGGFSFCTLGERAFDEHGRLNADVTFSTLAAYIWHLETGIAGQQTFDSPFLGVHEGKAYFLLYNGILGDRRPASGNVLNSAILAHLRMLWQSPMPIVVYGETTRIGPARLAAEAITFRQIPYDISMR